MAYKNGRGSAESLSLPRVLIIGAGARGKAYGGAIARKGLGIVAAVAEPHELKRKAFVASIVEASIHHDANLMAEFANWEEFVAYELNRRAEVAAGLDVAPGVDAAAICVLDEMHVIAIEALAPLNLHILCEKPLATSLKDCLRAARAVTKTRKTGDDNSPSPQLGTIFAIGHVLRYSPHNILLRRLVVDEETIGDIISIEHTEPVGWWHFTHSYVRGNWRKESKSAPSLLTKSCHDIDFILWLLCSPKSSESSEKPHLPSFLTSTGSLNMFRRARKPPQAAASTNCLQCPIEKTCSFSAVRLYRDNHVRQSCVKWPVNIVDPEIEDIMLKNGPQAAEDRLMERLAEDYGAETPAKEIESRPWFGRCVWESDNDVCDNQVVTITWDDEQDEHGTETKVTDSKVVSPGPRKGKFAKQATIHMVAFTELICERRGRIYGTAGEVHYDSQKISVYSFATGQTATYHPRKPGPKDGHGGGDEGIATQFMGAVDAVKNRGMSAEAAQREYLDCTLDDVIRSHAMVFAAEEARRNRKVVDWREWWARVNKTSQAAAREISTG